MGKRGEESAEAGKSSWTVEVGAAARKHYRSLPDGPRSEARDLLEELAAEGPAVTGAIELTANPDIWRARFHTSYRMIYRVSWKRKSIRVMRIKPRSDAYKGMRH